MLHKPKVHLLAVLVGLFATSLAVGGGKITGIGTFIDPDGDCRLVDDNGTEGKAAFEITVPGRYHDLNPSAKKLNGPHALREVDGDFTVKVRIANFAVPDKAEALKDKPVYRAAGLLLWVDGKNFITLLRAGSGTNDHLFAATSVFEDGKRTFSGTGKDLASPDAWLRLEKHEGKLSASVSDDGEEWTPVKLAGPDLPKKVKVGIVMVNASKKDFLAHFEDFSIDHRKAK